MTTDYFEDENGKVIFWPRCKKEGCDSRICSGLSEAFCYPHSAWWRPIMRKVKLVLDFFDSCWDYLKKTEEFPTPFSDKIIAKDQKQAEILAAADALWSCMSRNIKRAVELGTRNGSVENGLLEIQKWNPLTIRVRTLEGEKIIIEE